MISEINVSKEVSGYRKYLMLANFKKSTVSMYCRTFEKFLEYAKEAYPKKSLNQDQAQSYLLLRLEGGSSWSTINVDYSSLRKYFKQRLDYPWSMRKMPRPRREKVLPAILSREEVKRRNICGKLECNWYKVNGHLAIFRSAIDAFTAQEFSTSTLVWYPCK